MLLHCVSLAMSQHGAIGHCLIIAFSEHGDLEIMSECYQKLCTIPLHIILL